MRVMSVRMTLRTNPETQKFFWNVWMRDNNGNNHHKKCTTEKEACEYAQKVDPGYDKPFSGFHGVPDC